MDITLERILSLMPHKPDGSFVHGSKKEFAESIGLESGNVITDWEKGRNKSYKNYLYEIAVKYDVPVEWLKGETDEKSPPQDAESERKKIYASLEHMSRDELLDFVTKAMEVLKEK